VSFPRTLAINRERAARLIRSVDWLRRKGETAGGMTDIRACEGPSVTATSYQMIAAFPSDRELASGKFRFDYQVRPPPLF
jgi:hypothetical protein